MTEQILAVQRMQDYIETHLDRDVTMADLAEAANYSPWYAWRLFRQYTGLTPSAYLRSLRLSRSAMQLKAGACRVTDAALDAGFDSLDGYSRAFFREFGRNPGAYAKQPVPIPLFTPYGAKYRQLRKDADSMESWKTIFVQVVQKPARKVVLKRGIAAEDYFAYCQEVGCGVWGILRSMDSLCGEPVCLWLTQPYRKPGTSTYVQGVEVPADYDGPIPEGFDVISLPAAAYLLFQGEPFAEEDYCDAIAAVQSAINRYNPSAIGYQWDDGNPRIQLEPVGSRGYLELRSIRPLA